MQNYGTTICDRSQRTFFIQRNRRNTLPSLQNQGGIAEPAAGFALPAFMYASQAQPVGASTRVHQNGPVSPDDEPLTAPMSSPYPSFRWDTYRICTRTAKCGALPFTFAFWDVSCIRDHRTRRGKDCLPGEGYTGSGLSFAVIRIIPSPIM